MYTWQRTHFHITLVQIFHRMESNYFVIWRSSECNFVFDLTPFSSFTLFLFDLCIWLYVVGFLGVGIMSSVFIS